MNIAATPILLAQCKAYHSVEDILKEMETLIKIDSIKDFDIHISLPYSYIEPISKKFPSNEFHLGAEILLSTEEDSFTASIATKILEELKASFVLIGNSEDRAFHSNQLKNKVRTALANQIQPFICITDSLQEHQDKTSKQILIAQIKDFSEGLSSEDLKKIFIVYNAEWISRTPWEASSQELLEAYTNFSEAVKEALEPENFSSQQLIVAIPAYSQDVAELIQRLKMNPTPFFGYSIGILSSSTEFLQPLLIKSAGPNPEKTEAASPVETAEIPLPPPDETKPGENLSV